MERLEEHQIAGALGGIEKGLDIHAALEQLSEDHRQVLVLRELEQMTYEEIAQILEMTPEAVRKRVARSVEKFRTLYGTSPQTSKR